MFKNHTNMKRSVLGTELP